MTGLAEQLLLGSAKIDFMKREIELLTKMLFGLAERPGNWVRAHELNGKPERFHTTFGSLEDGCVWDVWWEEGSFHTRCLVHVEEEGKQVAVCAYGRNRRDPHLPPTVPTGHGHHNRQPEYKHLQVAGVAHAHKHLDVFAAGMLHDFPLGVKVKPFLNAARGRI